MENEQHLWPSADGRGAGDGTNLRRLSMTYQRVQESTSQAEVILLQWKIEILNQSLDRANATVVELLSRLNPITPSNEGSPTALSVVSEPRRRLRALAARVIRKRPQ